VMGSLPIDKASVGSAVNDTTRTTGGALGVAVLGSLLSSFYRGDMADAGAVDAASESLGGAIAVGQRLGDVQLIETAQSAFVNGMHMAAIAAAGVAVIGALLAYFVLPTQEGILEPVLTPQPEPVPA
jgi:MFS transporter, DHA2 family, multidrug resistance protein